MANLIRRGSTAPVAPSRELDPFEMMRDLLRWDPLARFGAAADVEFTPSFDVKETKDAYVFRADLPGVREADLDISVTANRLTVSGKREEEQREEGDRYFAYERTSGSFTRAFTLPEGIDVEHAQAELSSGVLTISLAKKPEAKPKKLEVKKLLPAKDKPQA